MAGMGPLQMQYQPRISQSDSLLVCKTALSKGLMFGTACVLHITCFRVDMALCAHDPTKLIHPARFSLNKKGIACISSLKGKPRM